MQIQTTDDVKQLGTILGVWAHPDDETFSMAGIMMAAIQNGQKLAFFTATRGEAGVQDESRWPAAELGNIRTRELEQAMKIMGITEHVWCDFPDGGCASINESEGVQKIIDCINKYQPDSILTFGPEGMTGHPDHQAMSRWASKACEASGSNAKIYHATLTSRQYEASKEADKHLNMFFNIDKPPVCSDEDCAILFTLSDELCRKKIAALRAMPSQYESMDKFFDSDLRQNFATEAFKKT